MRTRARKMGLGLGLAIATILVMASPASATTFPFDLQQINGYIEVGGVQFPVPGTPIGSCPDGDLALEGTVEDVNNTLSGTITASNAFNVPFGGVKYLELNGTATGTWDDVPPFEFAADIDADFTIKSYNSTTCTAGAVECFGTASISVEGVEILDVGAAGLPPFSTGDQVYVSTTSGQIDTVDRPGNPGATSCPGLLGLAVYEGASVVVDGDFEQQ